MVSDLLHSDMTPRACSRRQKNAGVQATSRDGRWNRMGESAWSQVAAAGCTTCISLSFLKASELSSHIKGGSTNKPSLGHWKPRCGFPQAGSCYEMPATFPPGSGGLPEPPYSPCWQSQVPVTYSFILLEAPSHLPWQRQSIHMMKLVRPGATSPLGWFRCSWSRRGF